MRRSVLIVALFLLIILTLITLKFYSNSIDISKNVSQNIVLNTKSDKPIKYFGVVSRYTPREIYLGYQPIMDYLTEKTPYKFELKLNTSYEGTARQLANGEISIASLGSLVFAKLQDEYKLEVILKPLNQDGNDFYHSIFITQDTSSILSLIDLKGKEILLPSKESLTGKWMPIYILEETGFDNIMINYTSHHTTVAERVLRGDVDAGVVKEVVTEIFKDRGLRTFHIAPRRTTIPIVISQYTNEHLKKSVVDALLGIDVNDPETRNMLEKWDEELSYGFSLANISDYVMITDLLPKLQKN